MKDQRKPYYCQQDKSKAGPEHVDPTANVLSLVEAAVKRLDDLRAAENRRIEDLLGLETLRTKEVAALHSAYLEKLALAESKRIDAIRSVDTAAVVTANEKTVQQAEILSKNFQVTTDRLIERILTLEKASYQESGRQKIADPQIANLVSEMQIMREGSERRGGSSKGSSTTYGYIIGGIGAFLALASLITILVHTLSGG